MDLKNFLESCSIGQIEEISCLLFSRADYLIKTRGPRTITESGMAEWVIPAPRLYIYCAECKGERHYNPQRSYPLYNQCIDLGTGPRKLELKGGDSFEVGRQVDQFPIFICGDCTKQIKRYCLAIDILDTNFDDKPTALLKFAKIGEIPKPIKPLNNKIKRLISNEWDIYLKGADDEAAGNGIGAFAYYRRVVEASRGLILDAMCNAAEKLNVPTDNLNKIKELKNSRDFTRSLQEVDSLFPSELKFNNQNALIALYAPLSDGIHNKSDQECLAAAVHIRTLLNELGERLEQVIDKEDIILEAMKNLRDFTKK